MLIHIDLEAGSRRITGAEDLKSLALEIHGRRSDEDVTRALAGLGTFDGEHVWLDVDELRRAAGAGQGTEWEQGYDGMIGYARSKGWTDESGTRVRAHVDEAAGGG